MIRPGRFRGVHRVGFAASVLLAVSTMAYLLDAVLLWAVAVSMEESGTIHGLAAVGLFDAGHPVLRWVYRAAQVSAAVLAGLWVWRARRHLGALTPHRLRDAAVTVLPFALVIHLVLGGSADLRAGRREGRLARTEDVMAWSDHFAVWASGVSVAWLAAAAAVLAFAAVIWFVPAVDADEVVR